MVGCGVSGSGEMYLTEVFVASDSSWIIGSVDYMNLVGHSFSNVWLQRPEL